MALIAREVPSVRLCAEAKNGVCEALNKLAPAHTTWNIEMESGVRAWLESLPKRQFGHVLAFAEKLAEEAATLGEPYSRRLGGKVRELRIPLHPLEVRVT
jgi:hypothetical protein